MPDLERLAREGNEFGLDAPLPSDLGLSADKALHNPYVAQLRGTARITDAVLVGAMLADVKLETCDRANLAFARLDHVRFDGHVEGACFAGADLRNCNLRGTHFKDCSFEAADLRYTIVDGKTRFENCIVDRCLIDRFTLEKLDSYGGLSRYNLMVLEIEDAGAELRASYTGFWKWLHSIALLVFLYPYIVFLAKQHFIARAGCSDESCTTIINALGQFIWTGGTFEKADLVTLPIFFFALAYNVLRGVLLWKALSLELDERIRRLPVAFSWDQTGWRIAFGAAQSGFALNVGLVALHTLVFLQAEVPTPISNLIPTS